MKYPLTLLLGSLIMLTIAAGCTTTKPQIIPQPLKIQSAIGRDFQITPDTKIVADANSQPTAEYLADILTPALGYRLPIVQDSGIRHDIIRLTANADGNEGYTLTSDHDQITIAGNSPAGVFYGVQTLRQLLPRQINSPDKIDGLAWSVPPVNIEDAPRYRWRGYMLDVSRHFFPPEYIKKTLDRMALLKLNTFHWHLTDDQGWRIEIKKYPKLQTIAAWRTEDNGEKYGGYYTQDQVRDIVAYAARLHITVVPEIEMPGHCTAALSAYPELASTPGPFGVSKNWGIHSDVYCPAKPEVYTFLDNVLDEVMPLFPGPFIHIGGDEVPKKNWHDSPLCQSFMKEHDLKNEEELQSYFVKKMTAYIQSKGKRVIGWDEILEGGLAPGAAVMSWRGTKGGIAAAAAGHDVVMSPTTHCYLDYYQSDNQQPPKVFHLLTLEKVYAFNPSADLTEEQATHVLGAQCNLWTEQVATPARADYQTYPRLCALAEVGWTRINEKNFPDFSNRLHLFEQILKIQGVNYFPGPTVTTHPATHESKK